MHRSISRSVRTLFPILALLTASVGLPGAVSAGGPGDGVPPLRSEGPIVLPNGKVLPVAPRGLAGASEMAVAWAEHQDDKLSFTPGARPHPLKAGGTNRLTC